MGRDALKRHWPITPFFCEDDFDPITGGPDEWTEEDEKKLKKKLDKRK